MGCDIHMYVEYKRNKQDKNWHSGDHFRKNTYFIDDDSENEYEQIELHGNRNYHLFSTLAGVRDYSDQVTPVSLPKGMPKDCCAFVLKECDIIDTDGHSHSYLTLKELRDYQSNNPLFHVSGIITIEQSKLLDEGIFPNSWCQGTNSSNYVRRKWSYPNEYLVPLIEKLEKRYQDLVNYGFNDYEESNDENIRIVFWFDN